MQRLVGCNCSYLQALLHYYMYIPATVCKKQMQCFRKALITVSHARSLCERCHSSQSGFMDFCESLHELVLTHVSAHVRADKCPKALVALHAALVFSQSKSEKNPSSTKLRLFGPDTHNKSPVLDCADRFCTTPYNAVISTNAMLRLQNVQCWLQSDNSAGLCNVVAQGNAGTHT